ncbi:hypothetical protein P5V15_001548 [Pogonomyrmex californicus]
MSMEDDFPISQHGILGSDFFKQFQVNVNYQENQLEWNGIIIPFALKEEQEEEFTIPARSISQMHIRVANSELKEGYVPRLIVTDGIYLDNALVIVRDDKAYLQVINTNEEEESVSIPTIEIYEFETNDKEISNSTNSNSNSKSSSNENLNTSSNSRSCFSINQNERKNKIIDALRRAFK